MRSSGDVTTGGRWTLEIASAVARFVIYLPMLQRYLHSSSQYYEKVGALPNRLQQPLWRSPPNTPARPCQRRSHSPEGHQGSKGKQSNHRPGSARRQSEVEAHKKAISRHRHNWERARTPPGYWDIGFPNTQEVGNINQKAKEMHKRKKDDIDREAAIEGGKYRRR